jgi:hypothetical protein
MIASATDPKVGSLRSPLVDALPLVPVIWVSSL